MPRANHHAQDETIFYNCGHRVMVGHHYEETKDIRAWKRRLEAQPCFECRLENLISRGYRINRNGDRHE